MGYVLKGPDTRQYLEPLKIPKVHVLVVFNQHRFRGLVAIMVATGATGGVM